MPSQQEPHRKNIYATVLTAAIATTVFAATLPMVWAQNASPAVTGAAGSASATGKSGTPATTTPTAEKIRQSLPGVWAGQATVQSGELRDTDLTYRADGTFNGETSPKDGKVLTYSGTWKVDGSRLTHSYKATSGPLPEAVQLASIEVAAIDQTSMTLRSSRNGREFVLVRR